MQQAARPTPCPIVLRGLLVAILGAWVAPLAIVSGQPREPQTPLTERAEIAPDGVTVRYPAGWSIAQEAHAARIVNLSPARSAAADFQTHSNATQVVITVEQMPSHAEALRKLRDTRSASTASTTFLTIGGWPALQQRAVVVREQPGNPEGEPPEDQQPVDNRPVAASQKQRLFPLTVLRITTAIAAGELFVLAEGQLLPDASAMEESVVRAISRSL
ncbi:MAG TPA: hypothetical protein VK504_26345, partial [Vicinamibacterales bacterium]|nr:hypothetical protein [Vicinamibacterales bacterium]